MAPSPSREGLLDPSEILSSLALLGEATKDDLLALHYPHSPVRRIERRLQPLLRRGLVERRARYTFDKKRGAHGVPVPAEHAYRLSEQGHALIANDPRYPVITGWDEYRSRLADTATGPAPEHDLLGTRAVAGLVVIARAYGLSGMFLRREQQFDPQARAPRIDMVLALHFGESELADGSFEWTKNPPTQREGARVLAVEIDRGTEALSIISGKAARYQEALCRRRTWDYWEEHYGQMPTVIWVAPSERRMRRIHETWLDAWPEGHWLMTTIERLESNRVLAYYGASREMCALDLFNHDEAIGSARRSWPARPHGDALFDAPTDLPASPLVGPSAPIEEPQIVLPSPRPRPPESKTIPQFFFDFQSARVTRLSETEKPAPPASSPDWQGQTQEHGTDRWISFAVVAIVLLFLLAALVAIVTVVGLIS